MCWATGWKRGTMLLSQLPFWGGACGLGVAQTLLCRRWIQTARGQFPALTHHKERLSSGVSVICKLGTITLPA